jgi:hypothetical protein
MIEKFALIMLLEDHEKKRYTYKLKNEKWDMINGHQPHFMDDDDYARMEEEHFLDIDERKKEEE